MLRARTRAGLSQNRAASAAGVSRCVVADHETGRSRPPVDVLVTVAKAYGTTASAILAEAEDLYKRFSE